MNRQELTTLPSQSSSPLGMSALLPPDGIAFSLDLGEILSATCKFAVDLLKVNHSGLVVFDSSHTSGHVISEYPVIGTKGLTIPLSGVPTEERLIKLRRPVAVPDISLDSSFSPVNDILREHGIKSVLIVPLVSGDRLIGSLGLDMLGEVRVFTEDEIKLCELFATQAAAVIELYAQNRQRAEQLAAIQNTALALNNHEDLRGILDTITSQAVQLLGAKDGGISRFHPERGELTVISDYKCPDFIGNTIKMDEGLAGRVMRDDLSFMAVPDYNKWLGRAPVFAKTERFGAVLMINLKWQNRTVGVLYINAERGREFEGELPPLLNLLAGTAAMAIANSHLLHEVEVARFRIRNSYETSSAMAELPDSKQVLQEVANQALEAAAADWVRLMLIDESGPRLNFVASRDSKLRETDNKVRDNGMSMRVLRTGEPYRCEDVSKTTDDINDAMRKEGGRAALCLPLSLRGRHLGVVWFMYSKPRKFFKEDEEALTAYLRQAAIAYDSVRQMEELEPLWLAAEGVAAADTTEEVMEAIVTSAREILRADYAILFPYNETDNDSPQELLVREAVTSGVDDALRREMLNTELPVGEVTRGVIAAGWLGVPDIDKLTTALPDVSRDMLRRLDAKSFEGLGLTVAGEKLGILYLVYRSRRDFRADEARARTFAAHAALALKKARLVNQVAKAQRAAREFTEMMTFGDLKETLRSFVTRAKNELRCDAVTLFIYDEATDRILPFTTMDGVKHKQRATHCEDAPSDSVVYEMIRLNKPHHCVLRVSEDSLFKDRPFAAREGIESVCAVPLKVREHRVGVMFINYRAPHRFTNEELELISLFAEQAAVAIHSVILYGEQQGLVEVSKEMLGARDLRAVLEHAVSNAADLTGADFVAIVLPDKEGNLRFEHSKGWAQDEIQAYEQGERYQTGYTIRHGEAVLVADYDQEGARFAVPDIVKSKKIRSGLSVPMLTGAEPVGAMLIHFQTPRDLASLKEWAGKLYQIASLTAVSIQHHRAVDSKIASLEAVKQASDEISRIRLGTDQKEVLEKIVEQAVACLPQAFMGTVQLYDEAANELRFEAVYSNERCDELLYLVGDRRPLVRRPRLESIEGKIGIAGRAILEKKSQLVDDVTRDPDYYEFSEKTKSELAVPLLTDENVVLGVLNVESKRPAAFSKDDEQALTALAKLVVTTIHNAEQYRLLKQQEPYRLYEETRKLADSYEALARMGMASNDWGHRVTGQALNIQGNLEILRGMLRKCISDPLTRKPLEDKISFMDGVAEKILQPPVAALLSMDVPLSEVSVNSLIVEQLSDKRYKAIRGLLHFELTDKEPLIRCSPDWIKRMLDILIDNAVRVMAGSTSPRLTVGTQVVGNQVEISVSDTGPGVPPEIRHKLLRQRIEKPPDSEGLGIGLLMVQAIAQSYRGGARVDKTGPNGTTMCVRLPVVEHN